MPAPNSTFAIGGVSYSADSLVVAESFVLLMNIIGKNPAHRKSANRYRQAYERACFNQTSRPEDNPISLF